MCIDNLSAAGIASVIEMLKLSINQVCRFIWAVDLDLLQYR